jgi:hypothetical protein
MMAGLPKAVLALTALLTAVLCVSLIGHADELQTDSVVLPPGDLQTSSSVLQPVYNLIDSNPLADPVDVGVLKASIEQAVNLGLLTVDQALLMLNQVEWGTLADADALTGVGAILLTVLDDLLAGAITDPLASLSQLLNELATPTGTLVAIGKAGAPDEILDEVSTLVAGGVPPGILVRITKDGLRSGVPLDVIMAQLDAIAEILAAGEDIPWGQLANDITGTGEYAYQDEEQNRNVDGNEAPEEEVNAHADNNDKAEKTNRKDNNLGQGNEGKDKDKKL